MGCKVVSLSLFLWGFVSKCQESCRASQKRVSARQGEKSPFRRNSAEGRPRLRPARPGQTDGGAQPGHYPIEKIA